MKKLGLALLAIVFVSFVGIGVTQRKEHSRQKRELSEMKEAYLALAMYRSDHGQFPAKLSDLIPSYLPEASRQRVELYQYSPQTPERLLVRGGTVVHADGSGQISR